MDSTGPKQRTHEPHEPVAARFPFDAPLPGAASPETVIKLERRGRSGSSSGSLGSSASSQATGIPHTGSSLWSRLFPSDIEESGALPLSPEGARLDHFAIEQRIGTGGMGAVFRAMDERLERVVALKVLAPAQARDEGAVRRFHNEARAAARLDHDNIARVHYIGEDRGLHFIAFEYVTGTNLRDLIRDHGRLQPAEAVNYVLQIAMALNHTSAAGVVHRDIKPSNIIITPSGRAKLVDLGLARKVNTDAAGDLTMAGTTLGTFDYISPEQAKDPRKVDVRSDIYSLGCTLYHMLAGEPPYPEGTVLQKLLDHQGKDPPEPALKNPHVGPELSAVVRTMMASDPRRRFQSAEELIRSLMHVAGTLGLRGLHPEGMVWTVPPRHTTTFWERNLGWMATAAALVLIAILVERWPTAASPTGDDLVRRSADADEQEREMLPGPRRTVAGELAAADSTGHDFSASANDGDGAADGARPELVPDNTDQELAGSRGPEPSSNDAGAGPIPDMPPIFGNDQALQPLTSIPRPTTVLDERPNGSASARPEPPPAPIAATTPETRTAADSAGGTGAPSPPPAVPMVNMDDRPFVVLSSEGDVPRPTLEAACADARDGSTIELRYDGARPGRSELPLRITNKSLTIRAGTKPGGERYRPLVEFAVDAAAGDGWGTRMITLGEASLELVNVDLVVRVRDGVPLRGDERWTLASLIGSGELRMHGVTVTLVNPSAQPAALVEMRPGTSADMPRMKMMNVGGMDTGAGPSFVVDVSRSLIRGTCDVLFVEHTLPARFELRQSVVSVDGTLLRSLGSLDMPERDRELELQLSHVTALVGDGLLRFESGDLPYELLPVDVASARNNIFASGVAGVPLVAMRGDTSGDAFRELLRWSGARNFYDGFEAFWSIESQLGLRSAEASSFDDWTRYWARGEATSEVDAVGGGIAWREDWRSLEASEVEPSDVALDRQVVSNPAIAAATDEGDVGADLSQIPPAPRLNPAAGE
ncbi:MAG: serine/threonine protein kinase [Planctomycetes bacterium]|nr:serine/threonine protein kinase [Planctomycetota bacterium]